MLHEYLKIIEFAILLSMYHTKKITDRAEISHVMGPLAVKNTTF